MLGVGPSQPPASSGRPRREAGCGDWRGKGYWGEGCQEAGTWKRNRDADLMIMMIKNRKIMIAMLQQSSPGLWSSDY